MFETVISLHDGHPAPALLEAIAKEAPDLVVASTHGQTDLPYVLMGSVAEKIVQHSPSPVLITRRRSSWPPHSALIPVDFSPSTDETLALAGVLAEKMELKLSLLHVVTPVPPAVRPTSPKPGYYLDGQAPSEKDAAAKLDTMAAAYPSVEATYCLSGEPAVEAICRTASAVGADLILIPTHRRAGLGRFRMGGVAEQVVRYAPCAVLSHCPGEGGSHV